MSLLVTPIPEALITELQSRFPHRCAKVHESIPEIYEYAGRVALVEYIRQSYANQQSNIMT